MDWHRVPLGASVLFKDDYFFVSSGKYGRGLFASNDLQQRFYAGPYAGQTLTKEGLTAEENLRNPYIFSITDQHFLDAREKRSSTILRYINCATHRQEQNCRFVIENGMVFIEVMKRISKGSELLTWYGDSGSAQLLNLQAFHEPISKDVLHNIEGEFRKHPLHASVCSLISCYRMALETASDLQEKLDDAQFQIITLQASKSAAGKPPKGIKAVSQKRTNLEAPISNFLVDAACAQKNEPSEKSELRRKRQCNPDWNDPIRVNYRRKMPEDVKINPCVDPSKEASDINSRSIDDPADRDFDDFESDSLTHESVRARGSGGWTKGKMLALGNGVHQKANKLIIVVCNGNTRKFVVKDGESDHKRLEAEALFRSWQSSTDLQSIPMLTALQEDAIA